ncbi:FAD-dependent thymidylate synthase [Phaeovibrio sulfidiphilus]|uniref:Flavin-dependent thymidylate synthase n=1 Tax=Phaeovibrio sulfidiphilus TaxID=1220600 RepID=A0A8J6YM84_9PROT|nr:FAD-dependent thymidylate synthase [Phaeovibrio sulfidiphilus]MBE1237010.1 FAD-dependent thymidylate synthase [Phaeovibrio sulfidiphilus]
MPEQTPRLVFAPGAVILGATELAHNALMQWAAESDYTDIFEDSSTPLSQLARQASEGRGAEALPEFAGRFCYRSFRRGRGSDEYVEHILESGHGSVLEHVNISFALSGISRSLTHELIRHRAGTAVSQESQRYVDSKELRFVVPPLLVQQIHDLADNGDSDAAFCLTERFRSDCREALRSYTEWQELFQEKLSTMNCCEGTVIRKRANEAARCMLPNAAETRMVWTMNLRAARHVIELRGHADADLEIRRLACLMARRLKDFAPRIFADIEVVHDDDGFESVRSVHRKV